MCHAFAKPGGTPFSQLMSFATSTASASKLWPYFARLIQIASYLANKKKKEKRMIKTAL
jgi:hypothetical protein